MKLFGLVFSVLMISTSMVYAAPAGNIQSGFQDFYSQTGVTAPSGLATLETGQQIVTRVGDVKTAHGFFNADIQKGDSVSIKKIDKDTILVIHEKSGLKMKVTLIKK